MTRLHPPPQKHPAQVRLETALTDGYAWRCRCGTITYWHLPCCHECGEAQPDAPARSRPVLKLEAQEAASALE